MTLNLNKGGNINLSKHAPGMKNALIGLGWKARETDGEDFDLDASAILCNAEGKAISENHFIFYGNESDPSGAVAHGGDERVGDKDGDDETIIVNLENIPAEVDKVVVVVSIYDGIKRGQNFGMVEDSYVRVVDNDNPLTSEEVRFDLGEDAANYRSIIFGELYRNKGDWKFKAIGQGFESGLAGIVEKYGLSATSE